MERSRLEESQNRQLLLMKWTEGIENHSGNYVRVWLCRSHKKPPRGVFNMVDHASSPSGDMSLSSGVSSIIAVFAKLGELDFVEPDGEH